MAADVAKLNPRTPTQGRITNNRSAILPDRRDTEAGQRRVFSDVRVARRGSGAEELQQILGQFERGAGSFKALADARFEKQSAEDAAQGALDFNADRIDENLLKTSQAYSRSVSMARAQRGWFEKLPDLETAIRAEIMNQTDPDPLARAARVDNLIEAHFAEFALDQDGKLKDFGSPEASQWLGEQMGQARAKAHASAIGMIEERMGEESITNAAETMRAKIMAGQDVEWNDVMSGLLPTVDRKAARGRLLAVVQETALTVAENGDGVRALQIIDGLLADAKRAQAASGPVPVDIPASDTAAAASAPQGSATKSSPAPAARQTLVMPFSGFASAKPSSKMGAARPGGSAHNGEDFPMAVGTKLVAPMGGEVIGSWRGGRGGHQVRVRLDNGAVVGMAHLSSRSVKVGDRVEAGQVLGLSGNTGRSSGPHLHLTVEVGGKKVSPAEFFSKAGEPGSVAAEPAGPGVDRAVLDPTKPSEIAAQRGGAILTSPQGVLAMTPEERLAMTQFRRSLKATVDDDAKRARAEEQSTNAADFLVRLHGVGPYPSTIEVQNAIREGRVSPEQGAALLGTIESDNDEAEAKAAGVVRATEAATTEGKETFVETTVASLIMPVHYGKKSPEAVASELLTLARRIPDREVRQAVIREVTSELGAITQLRKNSPQYRAGMSTLEEWKTSYMAELRNRMVSPADRKNAEAEIDRRLSAFAKRLSETAAVAPENVDKFLDDAERRTDAWFDKRYPRRAAPPKR